MLAVVVNTLIDVTNLDNTKNRNFELEVLKLKTILGQTWYYYKNLKFY